VNRALAQLLRLPTPKAAAALLGWRLVHELDSGAHAAAPRGVRLAGRIVETEAYLAVDDDASHSARGRTARNASMFLAPGHAYVYLIYGMHHCLNVVTAPEGVGEAVLVRAVEPLEGVEVMESQRGAGTPLRDLCRGPGRLCSAFGLTRAHDGLHLAAGGALRLEPPARRVGACVQEHLVGPRIGITKSAALPLRFREAGSLFTT
jgi:DNA-3-methyladenine glycosylase